MPPRLNKRELREKEELAQLAAAGHQANELDDDEESEEELQLPVTGKGGKKNKAGGATSGFAALDLGGDNDESEDDAEDVEPEQQVTKAKFKSKKKKKKPKSAAATPLAEGATPTTSTPSTPAKKGKADAVEPMDEIDRALAELAAKNQLAGLGDGGAASPATAQTTKLEPKWQAVKDVFAFEAKYLDGDAELRRFFGSKVISATPTQVRTGHHARFANNPHHSTSIRRPNYFLAQPEPGWSPPGGVLSLSRYDGPEAQSDAGEWWTFEHSQQYREAQLGFLEVLQQADGNRLYDVLQAQPYHVDTLMQLSEMQTQQGDLGASSSYLAKALYALSAPLPPTFPSGSFRLPFSKIENRAFFLAIARKVSILVKRGTWRTGCEWAKIALSTGGEADPVGMLVFIDFLGPKSKQNKWFLSLLDSLAAAYPSMRIASYPGLAYAKALCIRQMEQDDSEDDTKSTAALKSAIIRFPMIASLLFTALGGNLPPKMVTHRRAQVDGAFTDRPSYLLSLLSEFYVSRSSPLWKEPPVLAWLQKCVREVADSLDDSSVEDVVIGEQLWNQGPWPKGMAPAGVIRAAFISEIPSIRPYLPPSALSGTSYSYDPLPPSKSPLTTYYDDAYFAPLYSSSSSRSRRRTPAGTAANVPDMFARLQEQFGRMNPEQEAEFMRQIQAMMEQQGQNAPGGFPGMEEMDGETDEEDGGEEREGGAGNDAGPEAGEDARNLLGRLAAFFGPRPPAGPE